MAVCLSINIQGKGHLITLGRSPIVIGRSSSCNVKVDDSRVSSRHCEISVGDNGRVVVTDLNSTNGTLINETSITSANLFIGDILKMGEITISIDSLSLSGPERKALTKSAATAKAKFISFKAPKKSLSTFKADLTTGPPPVEKSPSEEVQRTTITSVSHIKKSPED